MAFLSSFDICISGMSTQRVRIDITAENIAHINTTRTGAGGPYRRKNVLFESFGADSFREAMRNITAGNESANRHAGVRVPDIIEDDREMKRVYNPGCPDVDTEGYVNIPNVNPPKETVDSMSATRFYEASVTALNATKLMAQRTLDIGR